MGISADTRGGRTAAAAAPDPYPSPQCAAAQAATPSEPPKQRDRSSTWRPFCRRRETQRLPQRHACSRAPGPGCRAAAPARSAGPGLEAAPASRQNGNARQEAPTQRVPRHFDGQSRIHRAPHPTRTALRPRPPPTLSPCTLHPRPRPRARSTRPSAQTAASAIELHHGSPRACSLTSAASGACTDY